MERSLAAPPDDVRLFFLYGPDEAGALALAARLEQAMGPQGERIDLEGDILKRDPARLADEAASFSMFGDRRWVRVTLFGDEILPAIEALLEAQQAGNPVIALGGDMRSSSRLVKRALDDPAVLAMACWPLGERDAVQLVIGLARERGLHLPPDLARRLVELTGGDRALMAGEVEKLALFLDAEPERPAEATAEALGLLSAEAAEGDVAPLVNAVLGGDVARMRHELAMLELRGGALASIMRPLATRAQLIAGIRVAFDASGRLDEALAKAGRAVFWKEKDAVRAQVRLWDAAAIARAIDRLGAAERATRDARHAGELVARHELLTIARQAARTR